MPISRYEIRNEYSLADPELYRAADKDDPEALLEGVAMAGLVGVLRQLGDLAEFAAEIFHDLHEEVMVTAARGHGLMIRVQQLEAEVPSIEKAFLSQLDHSSNFYNAGFDWHPKLRMDQNLVTQGDLPRFVMDSYEECRGPPRLFLLDKFDVAGAGACLKRYTDPSIFKVETSGVTSADGLREKKIRKAKKKGPRGRNGGIPEVLPTSHAKLHQLFLEEPVGNGVGNPGRHAKLKRRLNGFPFDLRTGKSYMEKVLKTPSPEHKMLHVIPVSSPVMLPTNGHNESGLEVYDVRPVSPDRERMERKISHHSLPARDETMLNQSINEQEEFPEDDKICEASNSYLSIVKDDIPSTLDKVAGEKDIAVDGESKTEGSLTGYQSDDIASEIDNYVDAPSTMDSEMDTDTELRQKGDFTSSIKSQSLIPDANEEHIHSQSLDSQSTGDSTISDDGNNSSKKEISSFLSSDSPSTSAENPQSEISSADGFPSAGTPETAINNASAYQNIADEDFPVDQHPKPMGFDDTCSDTNSITNHRSDFEELTSRLWNNDPIPTLAHSDSEDARQGMLRGSKPEEAVSTSNDEEKTTNLIIDQPGSPNVSGSKSLPGDDSPRSSCRERLADEPNGENVPYMSTVPDSLCHITDSSVAISADLLPEDDSGLEDLNLVENISNNAEMISTEKPISGKLDDEVLESPEKVPSDYTDIAHSGNNITSTVFKGEKLIDEVDNEESNVSPNDSNSVSCIQEAAPGKGLVEASLANAQKVEDHHSNSSNDDPISSANLIPSHIEHSPDWLGAGLDAYGRDVIPEEQKTVNETPELETSISCEVEGLQGIRISDDVTATDLAAPESSCSAPQNLENPAGTSDTEEKDGVALCTSTTALEVTEFSSSTDPKSLNEVHVLFNDSDSEKDQSETGNMASPMTLVYDNAARDSVILPVGLDNLVEEHSPRFEDSGLNELENDENSLSLSHTESGVVEEDKNYLSESHVELGSTEEVGENEDATPDLDTIDNDHPESELSDTVPNSYIDLEAENRSEIVDAPQIQPHLEQSGLDTDKQSIQQSGLRDEVSDAPSSPIDYNTEETITQEKIELPNQPVQELMDSGDISSELPSLSPIINHQQIPDHDDHKADSNSTSTFSLVNFPPSVSELPGPSNYDTDDVFGYPQDPFGSIFPPSNLFSETNHINLDELPPLPPLPPVQWRMGKLQHAPFSTEGERTKHKGLYPPMASADGFTSSPEEMNHSLIQIAPETASKEEKVEYTSSSTLEAVALETAQNEEKIEHTSSSLEAVAPETTQNEEKVEHTSSSLEAVAPETTQNEEKVEHTSSSLEAVAPETARKEEKVEQTSFSLEAVSPKTTLKEEKDEYTSSSLEAIALKTATKEEKVDDTSSGLDAKPVHETIDLPPKIENEQMQHLVIPTSSKSEFTSPTEEHGVANGSQTVKLPRPRNPLIADVGALDKSKLRKVTERVRPEIQKEDERDSLLEQIRAKSFNLKPAVASKPSIRGPNTNLNVAAILAKANAIRQAFAGSDEDDEDSWSDS